MFCKQCGGKMENTQGDTSHGTDKKIFRCVECNWTGVASAVHDGMLEEATKSEDIFHKDMKYGDYKAVITVIDADGERKIECTTWRADIIAMMLSDGIPALQTFKLGDSFTIVAVPTAKIIKRIAR